MRRDIARGPRTDSVTFCQSASLPSLLRLTSSANLEYWRAFRMSTETTSANGPVAVDGLPAQRRRWAAAALFHRPRNGLARYGNREHRPPRIMSVLRLVATPRSGA